MHNYHNDGVLDVIQLLRNSTNDLGENDSKIDKYCFIVKMILTAWSLWKGSWGRPPPRPHFQEFWVTF